MDLAESVDAAVRMENPRAAQFTLACPEYLAI